MSVINWKKESGLEKSFDIVNYFLLGLLSIITVLPFIYVVVASITPPEILIKEKFILIPKGFTLEAYEYVFSASSIKRALIVSVCITVIGTLFRITMVVLFAYSLAHKTLHGRRVVMILITFTLMFNGGTIPTYIIVRSLGLLDSYLALILPNAISTFNLVIFRNYFQGLPAELEESGKIDGASYPRILVSILLPLSLPLLATFTIMISDGIWNSWFDAMLDLNDSQKWPIQVILRQIINLANGLGSSDLSEANVVIPQQSTRMCTIVIATLPIMIVYPFLQKYFTKGMLLGSVKG